MGLRSFLEGLFGSAKYELEDDQPGPRAPSEPPREVATEDIEKVWAQPAQPPPVPVASAARAPAAAPPIDLKNGVQATRFSSTILIGLEERLRQDAYDLRGQNGVFLSYLRRTIAANGIRLPTMPEAVLKLDRLLRNPDCSITQVADAIRAEPAIATKVVGIANSPFYSGLSRTSAVEGAIGRLGLSETKNIVQAVAFGSKLLRVAGWEKEIDQLYHHSLVSALAARALGPRHGLEGDEAFIAGLIHDIGRSVLISTLGEFQHGQGNKKARVDLPFMQQLSTSIHADLSALVAESWNSAADVVLGIRFHHAPELVGPEAGRRIAMLLAASDHVARYLLEPAVHAEGLDPAIAGPEVLTQVYKNAEAFSVPLLAEGAPAKKAG
ncbi:MAG: HDOD domain-containing protein [Myxococcota bacterium]